MKTAARRKRKNNINLKLTLLGFGSLLLTSSILIVKFLFSDLGFAFSTTAYDLTQEDLAVVSMFTVSSLDQSKPIQLTEVSTIFYDKKGKKVLKYTFPTTLKLNMAGKFGDEELSKAFALGLLSFNDVKLAAESVNKSIERLMGFNIDRFILISADRDQEQSVDNLLFQGKALELKNLTQIVNSIKTDMSIREFYDIITFVSSLPQDRIGQKLVALYTEGDIAELLDPKIQDLTFDSVVALEQKNISVLNGSGVSGVALFGTRFVENIGGHVVSSDNASKQYAESYLIVDEKDSQTLKQLNKLFKIKNIVLKSDLIGITPSINEAVVGRSDITIILGFDFAGGMF